MFQVDYDYYWKVLITKWFRQFIQFFLPHIYDEIDFSIPPKFLDKELNKLIGDGKKRGNKRCDNLIQVQFKDGRKELVFIHTEVQHGYDKDFARRMFTYYYRIFDKYGKEIIALAIFTGQNLPPKPHNKYVTSLGGTTLTYEYNTYVVKDQKTQEREQLLEANENPFALVILSFLYLMKTKIYDYEKGTGKATAKHKRRLAFKLKLIELLKERGYKRETIQELFSFIRYVIKLPDFLEESFQETLYEKYANKDDMNTLVTAKDKAFFEELTKRYFAKELAAYKKQAEENFKNEKLKIIQTQKERLENEKLKAIKHLENEKLKVIKHLENEKLKVIKRLESEKLKAIQAEKERLENENLQAIQTEKERLENEKLKAVQAEKERLENEKLKAVQAEKEQVIIKLWQQLQFTTEQIAEFVQEEETAIRAILSKHDFLTN